LVVAVVLVEVQVLMAVTVQIQHLQQSHQVTEDTVAVVHLVIQEVLAVAAEVIHLVITEQEILHQFLHHKVVMVAAVMQQAVHTVKEAAQVAVQQAVAKMVTLVLLQEVQAQVQIFQVHP
jgi:hypothetical protein